MRPLWFTNIHKAYMVLDVDVPLICFTRFIKIHAAFKSHKRCQKFGCTNKRILLEPTSNDKSHTKIFQTSFSSLCINHENANTINWTKITKVAAICVSSNGGTLVPLTRDSGKGRSIRAQAWLINFMGADHSFYRPAPISGRTKCHKVLTFGSPKGGRTSHGYVHTFNFFFSWKQASQEQ